MRTGPTTPPQDGKEGTGTGYLLQEVVQRAAHIYLERQVTLRSRTPPRARGSFPKHLESLCRSGSIFHIKETGAQPAEFGIIFYSPESISPWVIGFYAARAPCGIERHGRPNPQLFIVQYCGDRTANCRNRAPPQFQRHLQHIQMLGQAADEVELLGGATNTTLDKSRESLPFLFRLPSVRDPSLPWSKRQVSRCFSSTRSTEVIWATALDFQSAHQGDIGIMRQRWLLGFAKGANRQSTPLELNKL